MWGCGYVIVSFSNDSSGVPNQSPAGSWGRMNRPEEPLHVRTGPPPDAAFPVRKVADKLVSHFFVRAATLPRRYPQIYASEDKLLVQPSQVVVERQDFLAAIASITPASHRSAAAHARPLPPATAPALAHSLAAVLGRLQRTFPPAAQCLAAAASREGPSSSNAATNTTANATTALLLPPGRTAAAPPKPGALGALALPSTSASSASTSGPFGGLLARLPSFLLSRPRLLVCGPPGCGQGQLAAALLYALEGLPCHAIGLPSLLANAGARSPEEALVGAFVEARR